MACAVSLGFMSSNMGPDRPDVQWPGAVRPWPVGFPEFVTHTDLPTLYSAAGKPGEDPTNRSETYREAKRGDELAAITIVDVVLNTEICVGLGEDYRNAIIASVHA